MAPTAARDGQLGLDPVDRDDPRRPGEGRAHDARQPDPAEPDDRHADAPAGTAAVLTTAPTPVDTQQPMSAATRRIHAVGQGDRRGLRDDRGPGHRADRAVGQDGLAVVASRGPSRRPASGAGTTANPGRPTAGRRGTTGRRRTGTSHDSATGWPTRSSSRRARPPRRRRRPRGPSRSASGRGHSPSRTWRSEWQTPDASIRTRTSPARGSATTRSSIDGRLADRAQDGGTRVTRRRRRARPVMSRRPAGARPDGRVRTGRSRATTSRRR